MTFTARLTQAKLKSEEDRDLATNALLNAILDATDIKYHEGTYQIFTTLPTHDVDWKRIQDALSYYNLKVYTSIYATFQELKTCINLRPLTFLEKVKLFTISKKK